MISADRGRIGDVDLACCRKQHLPTCMVPRSVVIVDAMPLNANGKIAKPVLRKLIVVQRPAKRNLWYSLSRILSPEVCDEEVAEHPSPNPMEVPSPRSRSCHRGRARSGRDRGGG